MGIRYSLVLATLSNHIDPRVSPPWTRGQGVTLFPVEDWGHDVSTEEMIQHAQILCRIGLPARVDKGKGTG